MQDQAKTIPTQENKPKQHHNLRWIIVSLVVGVALIATLVIQPWDFPVNAGDVLNKAFAVTVDADSFRVSYSLLSSGYESTHIDIDFISTTCYHAIYTEVYFPTELIVSDGKKYIKGDLTPADVINLSVEATSAKLGETYISSVINTLGKLEKLPDEIIEGEICKHYFGKSDPEKLDEIKITGNDWVISFEDYFGIIGDIRKSIYEYEFWISKENGSLRRIKITYQGPNIPAGTSITFTTIAGSPGTTFSTSTIMPYTSIYTFYDLNELINVEAPVDSNGQLLSGWAIVE